MTNYEAIKNMSIEAMAEFIANIQVNEINNMRPFPVEFNTVEHIAPLQKKWLEQECEQE